LGIFPVDFHGIWLFDLAVPLWCFFELFSVNFLGGHWGQDRRNLKDICLFETKPPTGMIYIYETPSKSTCLNFQL
jgi:hypothetical protein